LPRLTRGSAPTSRHFPFPCDLSRESFSSRPVGWPSAVAFLAHTESAFVPEMSILLNRCPFF
jgi:hypothetical protein